MTKFDDETLHDLIGRIYETAIVTDGWLPLLDRFAAVFNSQAALFMQDLVQGEGGLAVISGIDPAFVRSYRDYYGYINPDLPRLAGLPAGTFVCHEIGENRALYRTEYYNDWMRPQKLVGGMGAILEKNCDVATKISLNCFEKNGLFTRKQEKFFIQLIPHLQRSIWMNREFLGVHIQRKTAFDALDALSLGVLISNQFGQILFANRTGERLLRTGEGLTTKLGQIHGLTSDASQELLTMIRSTARTGSGKGQVAGGTLNLPRRNGSSLSVLVSPLPIECGLFSPAISAAVLFVSSADERTAVESQDIMHLFGLTPAESKLLSSLVQGAELKDYADKNKISMNTVKKHLQNIFLKTGKNRQSDLVGCVLSNPVAKISMARNSIARTYVDIAPPEA